MAKVSLSSPWDIFYKELNELFGDDPEINVVYDEEASDIKLYVDSAVKADALEKLLPKEKDFGNVKVTITVIPANDQDSPISLFEKAFSGNPAFSFCAELEGSLKMRYVVFANKVVQYYADNLADVNGLNSTLYADIASRVFEHTAGISFCTDTEEGAYLEDL